MLRFASLASGSGGNALLVEFDDTLLMIDCGLPRREIERRLACLGRAAEDVTAVLVTHEHADHLRGVGAFVRRYGTAVYATHGTARAFRGTVTASTFHADRPLEIGAIRVEPFTVPHDAHEPCQYVLAAGARKLGVLSDAGHVTAHIRERLEPCDALAVEFNHDPESLVRGSYPPRVKARVASHYGHLSNQQAAALVDAIASRRLQWLVALHVSARNNTPAFVRDAVEPVLERFGTPFSIADQDDAGRWIDVE